MSKLKFASAIEVVAKFRRQMINDLVRHGISRASAIKMVNSLIRGTKNKA